MIEEQPLHFDNSHFNKNSQMYHDVRPGYPKELYKTISKYKTFTSSSKILEIGAGSGIASEEIYNEWRPHLTLIEFGGNLCRMLYNKFGNNENVKIENIRFEDYQNSCKFDAIFSATAFHWLDLSTKYKKSYELLNDDGLLILYWNNFGIEDDEIRNKVEQVYIKYGDINYGDGKKLESKTVHDKQMEKIENRKREIEESKYFNLIEHKIIKHIKKYDADTYIKLLKSFPDHLKYKAEFFEEIEKIIIKDKNEIDIRIRVNLEIAEKKKT